MERYQARMQDVVAKLSRVNLQSTVSVLDALYVVARAFAPRPEFAALRDSLESLLLPSAMDSQGGLTGLRTRPNEADALECVMMYDAIRQREPELVANVRHRSVDAVISAASVARGIKSTRWEEQA